MSGTELLPCPFCGGEAMTMKAGDIGCVVKCRRCGILNAGYYPSYTHRTEDEFSGFTAEEYAIEAWNTRYEREDDFAYGNTAAYWHDQYEELLRSLEHIRDALKVVD